MIDSIATTYKEFIRYIKENKVIGLSFIFAFVCFGFMLTNYSLSIDEETWLNNTNPELLKIWLSQGRFGLYIFDIIVTPLGRFVPFLWDFLAVALWTFAGVIFSFCISIFMDKPSRISVFAFCAVFCSLPLVVGEIISFSMFNMQQSLAMVIMSLSVCLTFMFFKYRKKRLLLISALLLFLSSSFFQALPAVYVSAIVVYALLYVQRESPYKIRALIYDTLYSVGVFVAGVGLYFIINTIITTYIAPGGEGYLSAAYIGWDDGLSMIDTVVRTAKNCIRILLGRNNIGGLAMLLTTALLLPYSIMQMSKKRVPKHICTVLILSALLLISPFTMSLVYAMPGIVGRTYLALPMVCSAIVFLSLNSIRHIRWLNILGSMVVCSILALNAANMNLYFYRSYALYQEDKAFAQSLTQMINVNGYDYRQAPVLLVGKYCNNAARDNMGASIGSFFSWDEGNFSRMILFMNAEGYPVCYPTEQQIVSAMQVIEDIPAWPEIGCVTKVGDCIVVKLSEIEDYWYSINGLGHIAHYD